MDRRDRIEGLLLGCALGDAIGLPREGLSPRRAARLFGAPPLEHRFLLGRGMVSDDTEHTCMVAAALIRRWPDDEATLRDLAWQLRLWLLPLPAGVGFGTLRAVIKLWLGWPPRRSGVGSAGNGPAMRASVLAAPTDSEAALRSRVRACTRITHTHPMAEEGAWLVALGARAALEQGTALEPAATLARLRAEAEDPELSAALEIAGELLAEGAPAGALAERMGLQEGVTGYTLHTVPAALYCWLRHPTDARAAIEAAVALGGDADTVGAITGALAGATVGADALPSEWVAGLAEWPRGRSAMSALAEGLSALGEEETPGARRAPGWAWWGVPLRNAVFLAAVLLHAVRRALPPY